MSLTTLPTELLEQIVSHLDLPSFRRTRLTCSSVNQQGLHLFKERFFRTRTIKWTQEDLDRLHAVTVNETYGRSLQNLIIDATPRHSIRLWQTHKRISEARIVFDPYNPSLADAGLEQEYADAKKQADDAATFFNETRYDQKCLRTVFETLCERGSILNSLTFEYEGMDKKYGKFRRRYCEVSQNEMSRPFVSTMSAIASSNLTIKSISTHHINQHGAISVGRLESLAPSLRHFDAAFEKLDVLKLDIRDWRYPDSGFELESDRAPFIVRFLAKAQNVKTLALSCYSSLEDDIFGDMAKHCRFERLETCSLSIFRVNHTADLTSFLEPSSKSLRSLSLSHIALRDEDVTWPDFFRGVASTSTLLPTLEELELVHLFSKVGSRMTFDEYGLTTRLVVGHLGGGSKWRKELLDRVDEFDEGNSGPAWHLSSVAYPFLG